MNKREFIKAIACAAASTVLPQMAAAYGAVKRVDLSKYPSLLANSDRPIRLMEPNSTFSPERHHPEKAFRLYNVPGVPASGRYYPWKGDYQTWAIRLGLNACDNWRCAMDNRELIDACLEWKRLNRHGAD